MRLLDATDKGDLWKSIGSRFPAYQILPDTNWVSYVKNNILASIYTVSKSADIIHTGEHDVKLCLELSALLNHIWDIQKVGYYQFLAGERAALHNKGVTMVTWDDRKPGYDLDKSPNGNVAFKNIDPMKFMRDPFAETLDDSQWCCYADKFPATMLKNIPIYAESFKEFLAQNKGPATVTIPQYNNDRQAAASKNHHQLIMYWYRKDDGNIREVHTIDNEFILHEVDAILPNEYPFAELYCNLPGSGMVGFSEPAKIYADNLAYNLMQSIQLTAEYKNQRPPKFISDQSGLNLAAFTKYGDDADRTFIVRGDATKAVHYHQFPFPSSTLPAAMQSLMYNIKDATGVDDRYTGRDTGSIITTGGTQQMLDRVTLIDTPKVILYEEYTARLAKLVLKNLIAHAPKRSYYVKDTSQMEDITMIPTFSKITVDFPKIDNDILFMYHVQISSELPKNKQRVEAWANMILEKQMQYRKDGTEVEWITTEEWLQFQDVPYKEQMLKRMGVQRELDALNETNQVIYEYESLLEQGMDPNQAMVTAAQGLQAKRSGGATPFEQAMQGQEAGMMPGGIAPQGTALE
jgi:hypothetical protein